MAKALVSDNYRENPKINSFVRNYKDDSNAFKDYQLLPRFVRKRYNWNRVQEVKDTVVETHTETNGWHITVRITGAPIKRVIDGQTENIIMWPSDREERVESAIIKIASGGGLREITTGSITGYGSYFTVGMIRRITGMNAKDIKEAIEVLHKSNLEIIPQQKSPKNSAGKDISTEVVINEVSGSYLPVRYTSKKVGVNAPEEQSYCLFHPAVQQGIDEYSYRPYSWTKADEHNRSLTRWLHKYLILKYTYCAEGKSFHFNLRRTMNDFGYLAQSEIIDKKQLQDLAAYMRKAVMQLAKADVIKNGFVKESISNKFGEIVDYKFTVQGTASFTKDQIASNSEEKDIKGQLEMDLTDI